MVRFFINSDMINANEIVLTGDNAAHAKVLRLKIDERVIVCDGQGFEAVCVVNSCDASCCYLRVVERKKSESEPRVKVSIYLAFPKADKLEHVIQKATELGAYEIVTFPTSRSISRPDPKALQKKLDRWRKIAESAAGQSGRGRIPDIVVLDCYTQALSRAVQASSAIVFYENEHANTLHHTLEGCNCDTFSLVTGPEGGFTEEEIQIARKAGLQVCTLGRRILRCETAPLCALSALMYAMGEY